MRQSKWYPLLALLATLTAWIWIPALVVVFVAVSLLVGFSHTGHWVYVEAKRILESL